MLGCHLRMSGFLVSCLTISCFSTAASEEDLSTPALGIKPPALEADAALIVEPGTITFGRSATLTARFTEGAATVTPLVGSLPPNGSTRVTPGETTTYTMVVTRLDGSLMTRKALLRVDRFRKPPRVPQPEG